MAEDLHPSSTHPPLPPTTEDIRFNHLRLLRSRRVGPSTYHRLLAEHGDPRTALSALPEVAAGAGVKDYQICPEGVIHAEMRAADRAGARLLIHGFDGYPTPLLDLDAPPPLLWVIGRTELLERPMVSLVGARNASALGTRMAKALAISLGEAGYVLVSGLARGIDAAAHHHALDHGTIAVQGGGVDVMYPAENTELAERIGATGLRISEQPMGLQPMARHFPARNRIIAALGQACVVVEAAAKSGSLITARDALDLGRDVMAVPGHPFDARASGCNNLIRDGAILVRRGDDILEALRPIATAALDKLAQGDPVTDRISDIPAAPDQSPDIRANILRLLSASPVPEDQLLRDLASDADRVVPVLTEMEIGGEIQRHAGGLLARTG